MRSTVGIPVLQGGEDVKNEVPSRVGASAVYPYSKKLEDQFTLASNFEDQPPIRVFRYDDTDHTIHLPRRVASACPPELQMFDEGLYVEFDINFKSRSEEQSRVADETTQGLLEGKSFITQAPTGFGKTVVGCVAAGAVGRRFLVITTKEDIVTQWVEAGKLFLGLKSDEIGIWRGNKVPSKKHKMVIGLVQSIAKGPERYTSDMYRGFGLVICDEVHRMGAETFSQAMWWLSSRLRLGLSATPYRKDGRDIVFNLHIGTTEVSAQMEVMIPKVLMSSSSWKVPRNSNGEPIKHKPGKTMHLNKYFGADLRRNALIVNFLKAAYMKERRTIIFADTLAQLANIREVGITSGLLPRAFGWYVGLSGYPTEELGGVPKGKQPDGTTRTSAVSKARQAAKHKPFILATYQMASEATDIPWLDTEVLASPRSDVVQIVGRIRREYPGKKQPVVFDVVDRDSHVFRKYAQKRLGWYQKLGCEVKQV